MAIGFSLVFIALLLTVLMTVKLPKVMTKSFPIDNPIELPSSSVSSFYNLTLQPINKQNHYAEVVISPYYGPPNYGSMIVDFWVVNESGLGILISFLGLGMIFQPEYPDEWPFTSIMAYAKGVNITRQTRFELRNGLSNITYCLVLMNFFEDPQNVSVSISEKYEEISGSILDLNVVNLTVTAAMFTGGIYFVITSRKQKVRRAKIRSFDSLHDLESEWHRCILFL